MLSFGEGKQAVARSIIWVPNFQGRTQSVDGLELQLLQLITVVVAPPRIKPD
jgi:hypothetical protein